MIRKSMRSLALGSVFFGALILGCQPAEQAQDGSDHGHPHGHDHAHSDGPKSFEDAIAKLINIEKEIHAAIDKDDLELAHEPLHEVGDLLKQVPELAADTDLSESDWTDVKEDVDRLSQAFDDVDSAFHQDGDKKAAYDEAKSTIDEGIKNLNAKLAQMGIELPVPEPTHGETDEPASDHDHDDQENE